MDELVQKLVADFPQNPAVMSRTLRKLSEENWHDFLSASLSVLTDSIESHGSRYLVSMLLQQNALHNALCDPALSTIPQAAAIAKLALLVDPHFGVDFARRLTSLEAINQQEAERILNIVEQVSGSMRIRPSLAPLLHHPNRHICSKAALLIGRSNKNPELAAEHLSNDDARVRANAIEALWGIDDPACAEVFYDAAHDSHQRVAGNAIIGLYRLNHVSSIRLLLDLADRPTVAWQITAAWAMGVTASPRFQPALITMMNAGDPQLRRHAIKSLSRIRQASRDSQLAAKLSISLWPQTSAGEDQTKLIATVGSGRQRNVPNLTPTEFLLMEGDQPILDYSVVEYSAPPAMAIGIVIPSTAYSADPALLVDPKRMRPEDKWSVHQFAPESGFTAACNAAVKASVHHLICVAGASTIPIQLEVPRGKITIHAIAEPDAPNADSLEALCRETGGTFRPIADSDQIPALLQQIQVSLLDHYKISFTRKNTEAQTLTVRICSPRGSGESRTADPKASITAEPSSDAASDN